MMEKGWRTEAASVTLEEDGEAVEVALADGVTDGATDGGATVGMMQLASTLQ